MTNLVNNNRPQSPCKGCENRYVGCHSTCEDYLDFRGRSDEMAKAIHAKMNDKNVYGGYKRDCARKIYKNGKNRGKGW